MCIRDSRDGVGVAGVTVVRVTPPDRLRDPITPNGSGTGEIPYWLVNPESSVLLWSLLWGYSGAGNGDGLAYRDGSMAQSDLEGVCTRAHSGFVLGGVLTASGTPIHVAPPPAIDEFGTINTCPPLRSSVPDKSGTVNVSVPNDSIHINADCIKELTAVSVTAAAAEPQLGAVPKSCVLPKHFPVALNTEPVVASLSTAAMAWCVLWMHPPR